MTTDLPDLDVDLPPSPAADDRPDPIAAFEEPQAPRLSTSFDEASPYEAATPFEPVADPPSAGAFAANDLAPPEPEAQPTPEPAAETESGPDRLGFFSAIEDDPQLQADAGEARALEWDEDGEPETPIAAPKPQAPLSDRVFSTLADALVLGTIGLLLVIAGASAAQRAVVPFATATPLPLLAAWMLFGLAYGVFFTGTCGQTLGKMAMRVRVIGDDDFRVGYATAAKRTLGYALAALPAGLGLLTALRDPECRGLHDRLSGTKVVKA